MSSAASRNGEFKEFPARGSFSTSFSSRVSPPSPTTASSTTSTTVSGGAGANTRDKTSRDPNTPGCGTRKPTPSVPAAGTPASGSEGGRGAKSVADFLSAPVTEKEPNRSAICSAAATSALLHAARTNIASRAAVLRNHARGETDASKSAFGDERLTDGSSVRSDDSKASRCSSSAAAATTRSAAAAAKDAAVAASAARSLRTSRRRSAARATRSLWDETAKPERAFSFLSFACVVPEKKKSDAANPKMARVAAGADATVAATAAAPPPAPPAARSGGNAAAAGGGGGSTSDTGGAGGGAGRSRAPFKTPAAIPPAAATSPVSGSAEAPETPRACAGSPPTNCPYARSTSTSSRLRFPFAAASLSAAAARRLSLRTSAASRMASASALTSDALCSSSRRRASSASSSLNATRARRRASSARASCSAAAFETSIGFGPSLRLIKFRCCCC